MNDKQFRETVRGLHNPETRPEGVKDIHISVVVYLLGRDADEHWVRVDPETIAASVGTSKRTQWCVRSKFCASPGVWAGCRLNPARDGRTATGTW